MKFIFLQIILSVFSVATIAAQNNITGVILDAYSQKPIKNVSIYLLETSIYDTTDSNGLFFLDNLTTGNYLLTLRKDGYQIQTFPITLSGTSLHLGTILFYKDIAEPQDVSFITLTDDELQDDTNSADNISGLLQATQDIYLRTAAFEFSSSFFRIRGLDSGNAKVLMNGIEMNKLNDGRVQWSNWGGLNNVLRNQEFSNALSPSAYTFGGALGSTNINTRASEQKPGISVSYASSNRSYQNRAMATYSSGVFKNGWAITFSASSRTGNQGFNEGTTYNSYSLFASVEKKITNQHSVNFTAIYAPNRRGKSSPNTQEVFNLKGIQYNDYWGYLNDRKINSRIKEVEEPIFMVNHFWDVSKKTTIQNNISYQFGKIGNSRLDFNGGANPSPTYYQYLPSFQERNGDLAAAYVSLQNFQNNGQLDWNRIFDANITNASVGLHNAYVLYEDRNDDKQITANTIINSEINNHITVNAKLEYKKLSSNNFAQIIDLLGGTGYLDINNFADTETKQQNDLLNINRVVGQGDKFKYHYNLNSDVASVFVQGQFRYNKIDFFTAATLSKTNYQREGLYKNGRFTANSLGKSDTVDFTNYGVKAGATYKISGRHLVGANVAYVTNAPTIRNSFSNVRENNNLVENLESEKVFSADASYIHRSPIITSRLTGYYIKTQDATEISFYFADGVGGDNTAFVQEILTGIHKKQLGVELGVEAQVTPAIKLKGAASVGQFTYTNNPNLYLTSDVTSEGVFDEKGRSGDYIANLQNYKLASGPQNAYSVGFEYRNPEYWWIGATTNFFSNIYIDIAPLNRSENFYTDTDGLPFLDYNPELAKTLLQQEKFANYMVVNLIGGKSWKISNYFLSVFATVNNLFAEEYKSGGFEQGRNANFRQLRDDKALSTPVFGNRYWYGRGATYFLNVNVRF